MKLADNTKSLKVWRAALLLVGCLPMIAVHGALSLLMLFPLIAFLGGDLKQGAFLMWWLFGTFGLVVLVYSSATFSHSAKRLPVWQVVGLIAGILGATPLMFGFIGEWWASVSALLASSASASILVSAARGAEQLGGDQHTSSGQNEPATSTSLSRLNPGQNPQRHSS